MAKGERRAINIYWNSDSSKWEVAEFDNEEQCFVYAGSFERWCECGEVFKRVREWQQNGYTVRIL